jgi:hypothetical protein
MSANTYSVQWPSTPQMLHFQRTMLQDLRLTDVPGIDEQTAQKMPDANVQTPVQLMGTFMLFNCDKNEMKRWLVTYCGMRETRAATVTDSLQSKANHIVTR